MSPKLNTFLQNPVLRSTYQSFQIQSGRSAEFAAVENICRGLNIRSTPVASAWGRIGKCRKEGLPSACCGVANCIVIRWPQARLCVRRPAWSLTWPRSQFSKFQGGASPIPAASHSASPVSSRSLAERSRDPGLCTPAEMERPDNWPTLREHRRTFSLSRRRSRHPAIAWPRRPQKPRRSSQSSRASSEFSVLPSSASARRTSITCIASASSRCADTEAGALACVFHSVPSNW